jgi:hypothetical protein
MFIFIYPTKEKNLRIPSQNMIIYIIAHIFKLVIVSTKFRSRTSENFMIYMKDRSSPFQITMTVVLLEDSDIWENENFFPK